ncbi:hypothetical protein L1D46_01135 [Pseudoalteromonas sp. Isolate3]|uniref:hypothetical protein n=1 Tax=Pseudoalteromonas sp. Isolate3 TaxID=2908526 RepID=UPI001EFE4421|nr:hypothetical protein [Pseudoalteromonas sp. Isolate3]MCG9707414.1 hypothetical protein [Pseudoalteromonas sp. Isolate3]
MVRNKNKRKTLSPEPNLFTTKAKVQQLNIESMVLPYGGNCHLLRLKYKGCPTLQSQEGSPPYFREGTVLVDMDRDSFIRELYLLLSEIKNSTSRHYFKTMISYIRWLDDNDLKAINGDYVHNVLTNKYMTWCEEQCRLGQMKKSAWSVRRGGISWLLKAKGRKYEADQLPPVKRRRDSIIPHRSLDLTSELKPVVQALFKAYKALCVHFSENTLPDRHPLLDEVLLRKEAEKRGLSGHKLGAHKIAFVNAMSRTHPNNHIVRIAMMICYMFTGINTTPLASLRISDVTFKELLGGRYILDSIKGRAAWQEQDNSLGFSKRAKEYIESWLKISLKMAKHDQNAPLFPYFTKNGRVDTYSGSNQSPQENVNRLLARLGLPKITPSNLRKTKLDTLFQVTESVYLVSMTANNTPDTIKRSYVHGHESGHQKNLAASMDAKFNMAKGKDISEATTEAKFNYARVLDDYEYQRLREGQDRSHESRTPTGIRCNDNRKGSAIIIDKLLTREGIQQSSNEIACTDFLACWDCSEHAFVAEVTDIWLMLSFKETLQQLQQAPSINSMPEQRYTELFMNVETVLERFKEKSLENYQQAQERIKDAPHPLYSTVYSLNDLLEVFS